MTLLHEFQSLPRLRPVHSERKAAESWGARNRRLSFSADLPLRIKEVTEMLRSALCASDPSSPAPSQACIAEQGISAALAGHNAVSGNGPGNREATTL